MKISFLWGLLALTFSVGAQTQLTPQQQADKTLGTALYNQLKITSSLPHLTIAAEAGDAEAQYYLGELIRKKNHYMNPESQKWYEVAAEQGDLYAMIQLGRNTDDLCKKLENCATEQKAPIEWLKQAQNIAKPKAENGDTESMYIMYELTVEKNWLKRAADAGHPIAQYWMGITEKQGEGFFLPWQRQSQLRNGLRHLRKEAIQRG
ncbi:tetratricopeptide repeat protein [Pseudomonas sp. EL_65y_Pfl2_R96]|uniref:tetratricopeptide repeat protein n=1 Tax=Pseudomonas sp. EL_65y_Pfl2_R96 TaxID=3088699 RepID=UPI0030DD3AD6